MNNASNYSAKQQKIKEIFSPCRTSEERYYKIIELGKSLPPMNPEEKTDRYLVPGCQSLVYLRSDYVEKKIYFKAFSEALITSGLVALLILAYSGEEPNILFTQPPTFLNELGILASLSPARSNGLSNIYLRMQQEAMHYFFT